MTNRVHTKVRLVKCPRCSKILPEPEQVPLYACGGCGTILKAKHHSGEKRPTGLDSREQVAAQSNNIVQARDGGESSSSSQRSSPANGHLSNGNEVKDQNASIDHNFEQIRGSYSAQLTSSSQEPQILKIGGNIEKDRLSDQLYSEEHDVHQKEEWPIAANSVNEASFTEVTVNVESKELCDENHIARANSSKEASSTDESHPKSKDALQLGPDYAVLVNMEAQQIASVNGATDIEDDQGQHPHVIPSEKQKQVVDSTCLRENSALNECLVTESKDTVCNGSDHHILGESREEIPLDEPSCEKIPEEKTDYHDIKKIPNLAEEESNGKARDDSVDCVDEQLGGMKLSEISSSTEIAQVRDENSTAGTKANLQARRDAGEISSSNVSRDPQCESNSLKNVMTTPRQEIEGFDVDSKASKPIKACKEDGRPLKVVPRSLTKGSLAYDGSVSSFDGNEDRVQEQRRHASEMNPKPKNVASKEGYHSSKFQSQAKNSSQVLLDTKLKRSAFEEEKSVEENVFPVRNNRNRPNREFLPRVPLHRSSALGYENGSSFSYVNDEVPIHRMHHHRYKYRDLDPWVRKTYVETRDFDRRRFPHEAIWRENEFEPMYFNNYETSGEIYHRSNHHHGYLDRRRGVENWSGTRSGSLTRVHYSGEMFNERYQTRDPYMHPQPNDLRWSAQLPQPSNFCWDSYESCPTSPQRLMEPETYPWATHDVASVYEDQRRRDHIMRRMQLREKKQQVVKRHSCPLAGGAPFVTCYFCLKVVQLPKNLLLRRKTIIHRFKCGACSKILEFSLANETCLAPYIHNDASVSAETDVGRSDSVEVRSRKSRNEEKTDGLHRAEAGAGGQSFRGRQMKVTWQLPSRRSKSPLHRLMGYSSPRRMFNGHAAEEDVDW